ncbi:VPS11 [Symbiodinium natans]|uniref:VPS11 protein n=1 Tax=Symbiodinium natans TaxID=878477 RepID=A0A812MX06_9DINO|nr:VPS11 [Symbiodinium natans]
MVTEGCCIAVEDDAMELAEAAPVLTPVDGPILVPQDGVSRVDFDMAIRRLELRMEQLERQLRAEQGNLKVPEPAVLTPILEENGAELPSPKNHFSAATEEDADFTHDSIQFGESIWSLPLVLDFSHFPLWDGIFSMLLLIVNLGMQAMFSGILLSDDFAGAGVQVEEERENARRWRIGIAHDWRYMDLSETSLVTRVCQSDGALILSTPQAELVDQINSFLGLGAEDFVPGFFQPGILLCLLCILHWSLCVYKEFRSVWLAFEAVLAIPRASRSITSQNRITSLSRSRLLVVLTSFVLRMAIASIMLVAGIQWLGRTTSITELMLNAVALNGIMDIDELLFAGFTPVSVQQAIRKLEPVKMKYSRYRSQFESFALFLLLLVTMLVPYLIYLEPLGSGMVSIKWEMCGKNQTFVVANNPANQQVIGYRTKATRDDQEPSLVEIAVEQHKFQESGPPKYIFFASSMKMFSADIDEDMNAAAARTPFCVETDALWPGTPFHEDPVVTSILHARLRSALVSLGQPPSITCDGVAHLCNMPDARLLRLMCGYTCGCTDPYSSSPWHRVQAAGCSVACTARALTILATQPCEDQPAGDAWEAFWDGYAPALSDHYGLNVSQADIWPAASSIANQLRVRGCPGLTNPELQLELITQTPWCQGHERLFRPLAWICPRSCGCFGTALGHCPASCVANASTD